MPSLAALLKSAHPNSALNRKFPRGMRTSDLPNWTSDRTDGDAWVNVGFDDDYEPGPSLAWRRQRASVYRLPTVEEVEEEWRPEAA